MLVRGGLFLFRGQAQSCSLQVQSLRGILIGILLAVVCSWVSFHLNWREITVSWNTGLFGSDLCRTKQCKRASIIAHYDKIISVKLHVADGGWCVYGIAPDTFPGLSINVSIGAPPSSGKVVPAGYRCEEINVRENLSSLPWFLYRSWWLSDSHSRESNTEAASGKPVFSYI